MFDSYYLLGSKINKQDRIANGEARKYSQEGHKNFQGGMVVQW